MSHPNRPPRPSSSASSVPPSPARRPAARAAPRAFPPVVALALAEEMATAVAADEEGRRDLVDAALAAGQWLADEGRPGRWDTLDPKAVLRQVDFLPARERDRLLLSLAGLIGFAAFTERLPPGAARRRVLEIAELAADEVVRTYARHVATQVAEIAAAG